jgi:hypothetical protein
MDANAILVLDKALANPELDIFPEGFRSTDDWHGVVQALANDQSLKVKVVAMIKKILLHNLDCTISMYKGDMDKFLWHLSGDVQNLIIRRWDSACYGDNVLNDLSNVNLSGKFLLKWVLDLSGPCTSASIVNAFKFRKDEMMKCLCYEKGYFDMIITSFMKMHITYSDVIDISQGFVEKVCGLRLLDRFEEFVTKWTDIPRECQPRCLQFRMENFDLAIELARA